MIPGLIFIPIYIANDMAATKDGMESKPSSGIAAMKDITKSKTTRCTTNGKATMVIITDGEMAGEMTGEMIMEMEEAMGVDMTGTNI